MLKILLRGIGVIVLFLVTATGSWILYSRFIINNDIPLTPALDVDQEYLDTPAGRVAYYADTTASGRPLVLIHSMNAAAGAYEMAPLFTTYRTQRPVYALDLPGFGMSDRLDQKYSPELYAATIEQFLDEIVGEPADVVALSLGSEFAARAAYSQPEAVRTLVFLSPTGLRDIPDIGEGLYRGLSFPLWGRALYDLLVIRPALNYFLGAISYDDISPEYIEYAYLTAHQPGAHYAPLYFVGGQLFSPNIQSEVYEGLTMPVLAIYGNDPNTSFDNLPALMELNPNWTAQRFEQTNSLPHWDQPADTIAALEAFWAGAE